MEKVAAGRSPLLVRRGCCHGWLPVRGTRLGDLRFFFPGGFIVGPQEVGTSAGRGSLTPDLGRDSIGGNVLDFRTPSKN